MDAIVLTIVTGLVATAAMSALLYLIHWRGFANADMIRAIGSIVTRNETNALWPGMLVHFGSGVIFAFLYVGFWSTLPVSALKYVVGLGALMGVAHGLVVSFMLVILVAEHHPIVRFQQAGMGVAISHLLAHVVYGLVIGLMGAWLGLRLGFMPQLL